ncbi:hypothetical protein [Leucobacter iarius]|uniref:Uncharacterized protein n=1 Tax=Leucobacter iarius TaxID=333963 RepID=A0ABP4XMP7_9MICO
MDNADAGRVLSLDTHDNQKVLEILRESEDRDAVFCYLRFWVRAAGPRISASGNFAAADVHVEEFVQGIENGSKATLWDIDGEGAISIECTNLIGHFNVSVWLGNVEGDRAWISFETDQTAIIPFARGLKRLAAKRS